MKQTQRSQNPVIRISCYTKQDPRLVKNAIRTLAREVGADWTDFTCFLIDSLRSRQCHKEHFLNREPRPFVWTVAVEHWSSRANGVRK